MPKQPKPRKWRIIMARHRGAVLGTVEAPDAASAIKIGAERFGIPEWRLIAQLVE